MDPSLWGEDPPLTTISGQQGNSDVCGEKGGDLSLQVRQTQQTSVLCSKRRTRSSGPGRKSAFDHVRPPERTAGGAHVARLAGGHAGGGRGPARSRGGGPEEPRGRRRRCPDSEGEAARALPAPPWPVPRLDPDRALAVPALPAAVSAHAASPPRSAPDGPGRPAIRAPRSARARASPRLDRARGGGGASGVAPAQCAPRAGGGVTAPAAR